MSPDIEKYLRIRLAELDDEHGDHPEYGVVFGVIEIDFADVGTAALEHDLAIDEGICKAAWYDNGVVAYEELVTAQDYADALRWLQFMKDDYHEFCNMIDADEV